jgi:hypothetical protein
MTDPTLARARAYIESLDSGEDPGPIPALNGFSEQVSRLREAYDSGGSEAVKKAFKTLVIDDQKYELLRPPSLAKKKNKAKPKGSKGFSLTPTMQPLPDSARLPEGLSRGACQWLEDYVQLSKRWSPSGYEGFHEAVGLWILSTIAARRIATANEEHTPLDIALVARSGLYAKSTTAMVGVRLLKQAGLGYLLLDGDHTPQSFVKAMTGPVPDGYARTEGSARTVAENSLAFSAQRSWYKDEFGGFVGGMRKKTGHMHAFMDMLRSLDGCPDEYTVNTIGRGQDKVIAPYLALLACMTPSDLRDSGKAGSEEWGNGLWARMAFIGPDGSCKVSKGRIPNEKFKAPPDMVMRLHHWHKRLGIPEICVNDDPDSPGKFLVDRGSFPENVCEYDAGVEDAFYAYKDALTDMVENSTNMDLDSNYARFAVKALRIAMLVASLENEDLIEMKHWALGQEIAERWRANLHSIFGEINEPSQSFDEGIEDRIVNFIERWTEKHVLPPTLREIRNYNRGIPSEKLTRMVTSMVGTGEIREMAEGRTKYYALPDEDEAEISGKRQGET